MRLLKSFFPIIITIFLYLFIFYNSAAQIPTVIEVSGEIAEDTTWTADTVKVTGDISVMDDVTLTIDPGTIIEFQDHYVLKICGTLLAEGEQGDTIVFTAKDQAIGWRGIRLNNTHFDGGDCPGMMYDSDTSVISHCKIQYVKDDVPVYIRIFTKCKILNSSFVFNQSNFRTGVIYSYQGGGKIEGCNFSDNVAPGLNGGALYIGGSDAPYIIRNNIFRNNSCGSGGAIWIYRSDVLIENNKFINNQASDDGGAVYTTNCDNVTILNNLFANNTASKGGAIFHQGSNPKIVNNTIVNNRALTDGGAIYFAGNSDCEYYSDIIWGNIDNDGPNQVFIEDDRSDPLFKGCDIQGDSTDFSLNPGVIYEGLYSENIDAMPGFTDPSTTAGAGSGSLSDDWSFSSNSPCINKGVSEPPGIEMPDYDLDNSRRVAFGKIDIGAYEYYHDEMTALGTYDEDIIWAADTVKVLGDVTISNGYTLSVLPGVYVLFTGDYKLNIQGRILARGIADYPITFSIPDSTGISVDSIQVGWRGIRFDNTPEINNKSEIDHAILEYCEHVPSGAIYINNYSKVLVTNSIFRNNWAFGLSIDCGGGGIHCRDAGVTIQHCIFENNNAEYYAGAIYADNSDINIENSIISYNKAYTGGGISLINRSNLVIKNSIIVNNIVTGNEYYSDGGALYSAENSSLEIVNCVISNNEALGSGGIIQSSGCTGYVLNSTFVNNYAYANYGGIFLAGNENDWKIVNSIIWGNRSVLSPTIQLMGAGAEVRFTNIEFDYSSPDGSNIAIDPAFSNPSDGPGTGYDGLYANWSLTDFSPCVNTGTTDIETPIIPDTDLAGQNRINQERIDMGAYEHQGSPPVIVSQPENLITCEGTTVTLSVQITDTALFQWQKDGSDIPGAKSPQLVIDAISLDNQGSYRCIIRNAYDTVSTIQANVVVYARPAFQGTLKTTWAEMNEEVELRTYAKGTNLNYQWQKDGLDIPGATLPEYRYTPVDSTDEGYFRCIASNMCGSDITEYVPVYLAPQLCMVTVSTITGNNLVIWEKNSIAPIDTYNIYRETTAAGIYDLMGIVPYSNLSVFEDTTADPTKRAYIYKITGVDTSGYETDLDLCKPHKTIHLLVTTNPELKSTQLAWDKYFGFDYQTYNIYRSSTGTNYTVVDAMPSTLNSWTDPEPVTGELFYRVAVEKLTPCLPSGGGKKADAGPYSHSMSNMDDNRLQAGENPPDTIMLTNDMINENNGYGMLIGRFRTTDLDSLDTHTYSLISGYGDDNNISFTILGDMLLAAEIFDYEIKDVYTIRVRCTDNNNLTREEVFTININDVVETGLTDNLSSSQIQVYPNPFNKSTILMFNNPESHSYTLYIMDLSGKVCRIENHISSSKYVLEKGDLREGFYFIELRGPKIYRGKVVVE